MDVGMTALHIASQKGQLDVTKYLISQGVDVNKGDNDGRTALHSAAQEGHLDVTKYLISQRAEVNKGDKDGMRALHSAAQEGHLDVTKYLISQGADVNRGYTDNRTALNIAAFNGHLNVTKYLISQGADVNKRDDNGWTALHTAAFKSQLNVIKYLISQGAEVDKGDDIGWTALHNAAEEGHLDVIKYLISQGAEVDKGDYIGRTALHKATEEGHLDVLQYLISQVAEVDKGDDIGWTALHNAAEEGHLDVIQYFISQGADVNEGDKDGRTALHSAAEEGHLDVTKYLISQRAEVNKGNIDGRTPLHHAVQNGNLDVVKVLLEGGALSDTGDIDGHTPLQLSLFLGYQNIADLFIDCSNSKLDQNDLTDIHLAIQSGHTSTIEKLISEGADLNVQSSDGQTCLHRVIKLCYKSDRIMHDTDTLKEISNKYYKGELSPEKALVFHLLENGAKIDVRDKSGNLPIQYANDEVVKQMILSRVTTDAEKSDYDNFPEKAQSDRTDSAKPIKDTLDGRSATGNFGALGGKLSTESHGFTLQIPPGALEEDEKISLQVLTEIPNGLTLEADELLVSHGFQCYPSGLRFKKPAKLIIPHCALVTAPNKVQTILYSWNKSGTPQRLPDSSNIICSVQEQWLEVSISHFSGGFFAVLWDWLFLKSIILSCMAFLPRLMPFSRKPILDVRFVKKPHGQNWKDVHELDDPRFQHVKGDDDDILFLQGTLTVACQLGEKSPESEAIQFSDMRSQTKVTKYFDLDLTEERKETLVTLKVIQNSTQTIKFNTRFQGIDNETTEQDAFSPAIDEMPTEESREQGFDDLLKTIAKRIHKVDDIDSLGGELGFESPEIQRYIQINEKYHNVTCMGTLSMLRDWRNRTKRSEEREQLKKALIAINHVRLVDDLLNDG